jgi:hypothetical protein
MGKVGPVAMRDMLMLQVPFLIAAALTKLGHDLVLRDWLGLQGIAMIAASATLAYALATGGQAMLTDGRARLRESADLISALVRRRVAP